MRTTKFLSLLCFALLLTFNSKAQENDQSYMIQLATFSSWAHFAKQEQDFYVPTGTADNNIYAEQIDGRIKVYLFDTYEGSIADFYPGEHLDKVLEIVRSHDHFKGAFRKPAKSIYELTPYGEVFEKYRNEELPDLLTAKGGSTVANPTSGLYKVQLGAFKTQKGYDYIAENYGLNNTDKAKLESLMSHDFTKVKKDVCRRYYFGQYNSKSEAIAKKKALEKATKRKLMVVKQ